MQTQPTPFRLVAWNIRAGGGKRVHAIADQLIGWRADVIVLSEFRSGPAGQALVGLLADAGLAHSRCASGEVGPAKNAVCVVSRWRLRLKSMVSVPQEPGRWLMLDVGAPQPFSLGAMHIPNQVTGRKGGYHDAVLRLARRWHRRPAVFLGDTNSGKIGLDEERPVFNRATDAWMDAMEVADFKDVFRHFHGLRREYTWFSPNGNNGFRLDQAFANKGFLALLTGVYHNWGGDGRRRDQLSDHAALILDGQMA